VVQGEKKKQHKNYVKRNFHSRGRYAMAKRSAQGVRSLMHRESHVDGPTNLEYGSVPEGGGTKRKLSFAGSSLN